MFLFDSLLPIFTPIAEVCHSILLDSLAEKINFGIIHRSHKIVLRKDGTWKEVKGTFLAKDYNQISEACIEADMIERRKRVKRDFREQSVDCRYIEEINS